MDLRERGAGGRRPAAMSAFVEVVPEGWWALGDADGFFPEDLPPEWRLTYYANQFGAVLVPPDAWPAGTALRDWRDDVHGGFRFYLGWDDRAGAGTARELLDQAHGALGDTLAAVVRYPTLELLTAGAGEPLGSAVRCPRRRSGDMRAARAWGEALVRQQPGSHLVILDRPTAAQLEAWRTLTALMGLHA